MENFIYLQCDSRFNKWMLEKINNQYVVEHTLENCRKIKGAGRIVAGIYGCPENRRLIEILEQNHIDVRITDEENVNKRFLDIAVKEKADYAVRVGGDQCLLDFSMVGNILTEMERETADWYYEYCSICVLPDIVHVNCLRRWKEELERGGRYFNILGQHMDVKRYALPYPALILFPFRANSNEGFRICRYTIEKRKSVYELSKRLAAELMYSKYMASSGLLGSWILPGECEDFYYDENKDVNPWLGKCVVDFIKRHLDKSYEVFEWGSGNSTLFWSRHVKSVVSVEHDMEWYEKMLEAIPDNARLEYCELEYGGGYCEAILREEKKFDIIMVDGRDRVNCMFAAVSRLKDGGIIILDDSERKRYRAGDEYLRQQGYKKLELRDIAIYGLPGFEKCTSIYYGEDNIWNL